MTCYHFQYINGEVKCLKTSKYFKGELNAEEALDELSIIGNRRFKKIKLYNNTMVLSNDVCEIEMNNLRTFERHGYLKYFGKNLPKIQTAIKKRQLKKYVGKQIKTNRGVQLAIASGLVAIALAGSLAYSNDKKEEEEIVITVEPIVDDDYQINIPVEKETTIKVEEEQSSLEEYNDLLSELEEQVPTADINYEYIDTVKQQYAYENYYELVSKFANKWGMSPNIPMSVLTQESGGKNPNLMQIQFDSWIDMPISGYNYENNTKQTIVLTDTPEKYNSKGYTTISRSDLKNPYTNISIGTLILNYSIKHMNYHISAGLQAYNFGLYNMDTVLNKTAEETGVSKEELLADQSNTSFTDYTDIISVGDSNYLSNVVRFNMDDEFFINEMTPDGEIETHTVKIATHSLRQ